MVVLIIRSGSRALSASLAGGASSCQRGPAAMSAAARGHRSVGAGGPETRWAASSRCPRAVAGHLVFLTSLPDGLHTCGSVALTVLGADTLRRAVHDDLRASDEVVERPHDRNTGRFHLGAPIGSRCEHRTGPFPPQRGCGSRGPPPQPPPAPCRPGASRRQRRAYR
jgi:hypothetical protein